MSEKPSPKPPASKTTAKTAGNGSPTSASGRTKAAADRDETFDFLGPPQAPGEIGRLAHYAVLKLLGKGGMGLVFMAKDTRLDRIVALKVMLPSIAKKAIARDRFIREARATAAIEHDNIVTIYEVNEDKHGDQVVPYLVMQLLKGVSLEDWLKAGKKPNVPQIMRIGKEIAKALAAAHACKLIHRDIKPSNIWLDQATKGRVKILDFGLARPTNEETHLTQEGMILGSPAYMSPEQARGQNVDERCDLFSLGCVLYRLCAGRLPFAGKDAMSMLLAITSEEPAALAKLNDDLPPSLADLVHQLLAKKPEDRPASAQAVVQAIQNLERDWVANAKTTASRPVRTSDAATTNHETIALDPDLEESAITDVELEPAPAPPAPSPPPARRGSGVLVGLGCSLLTVIAMLGCLGIMVWTNHGEVAVAGEDDKAKAWLEETGLTIWDHNHKAYTLKAGEPQQLPAGGYTVEIDKLPPGLQIDPTRFSLHRGDALDIKVRFVPPQPPIPPTPPKSIRPTTALLTSEQAKKTQNDWAAYLQCEVANEKNPVKAKMVLIPPGEFVMGSSLQQIKQQLMKFEKKATLDGTLARLANEGPPHRVRISKPFYLGATEVTVGQFSKFVAAKAYKTIPETNGKGGTGIEAGRPTARNPKYHWHSLGYSATADSPVTNITWDDAEAYCKWLSERDNKVYRLPTEAEWEYACRAGTTTLWHFGDDLSKETHAQLHVVSRQLQAHHQPRDTQGGCQQIGKQLRPTRHARQRRRNVRRLLAPRILRPKAQGRPGDRSARPPRHSGFATRHPRRRLSRSRLPVPVRPPHPHRSGPRFRPRRLPRRLRNPAAAGLTPGIPVTNGSPSFTLDYCRILPGVSASGRVCPRGGPCVLFEVCEREYHPDRFGGNQAFLRRLRGHLRPQEKKGGRGRRQSQGERQKARQGRQEKGQKVTPTAISSAQTSRDRQGAVLGTAPLPDGRGSFGVNRRMNLSSTSRVSIGRDAVASSSPYDTCSDEELLALFRQGTHEAFGALVRRYEGELYGYLAGTSAIATLPTMCSRIPSCSYIRKSTSMNPADRSAPGCTPSPPTRRLTPCAVRGAIKPFGSTPKATTPTPTCRTC